MMEFERLKHSRTRKPACAANVALRNACNAKKMSVRDLAERIREKTRFQQITGGHLSRMADPKGDLLIESDLADWIATQIDYPASRWKRVKPSQ
jgi:cytidylate kinase